MTFADLPVLLPLIIIGYSAIVVLVAGAFWKSHSAMGALTLISLAAGFLAILAAIPAVPRQVTPLLYFDRAALFYSGLFFLGGFAITLFAHDYLKESSERFYALLLLAVLGMGVLVASNHFVSFFIGLETLSVSLYGLIGYTLKRSTSLEASLKYLVLAGAALAFLLFGLALLYFEFGSMEFATLAARLQEEGLHFPSVALLALALILVGFFFKLAVVPFHTWAPDVYQGAPAPISALVATGSKAAMFALLLRFLSFVRLEEHAPLFFVLQILAISTMFAGNLLALLQRNLKRLLAYSSIAHIGYLLIPLLAGGEQGTSSIAFYFVSYFITTIGAFGVISALSARGGEVEELESYRGLGLRRPWLGAALALMMLSLAGIPPTIGFMAKFYVFAAAARSGLWLLLVIGLLNSGLAAYYYLRVLIALYSSPEKEDAAWPRVGAASGIGLALLSALIIIFGLYPTPLISQAEKTSSAAGARQETRVAGGHSDRVQSLVDRGKEE